jgi:hypothetical protein
MATGFYEKGGKQWIDKDPDDKLFYAIDMADELALSNTTLATVEVEVAGVSEIEPAYVDGTKGVVFLTGLDVSEAPVNWCRMRFTFANGEQMDKTFYLKRKDG